MLWAALPQAHSYLRRLMSAMPAAHAAMPAIPSTAANAGPLGSPVPASASDELEAPLLALASLCRPRSFRRTGSRYSSRPRFPGRGRRESRGRWIFRDRVFRAPPGPVSVPGSPGSGSCCSSSKRYDPLLPSAAESTSLPSVCNPVSDWLYEAVPVALVAFAVVTAAELLELAGVPLGKLIAPVVPYVPRGVLLFGSLIGVDRVERFRCRGSIAVRKAGAIGGGNLVRAFRPPAARA